MLGVKDLSSALPLNLICQASSLDHGHKASWWQERLFFDGWLSWLDLLDRGGLMALLHHVCRWVRWGWWSVVSYRACHRLLYLHPLLKCLTKAKEFPALDEKMGRYSHSIFVDVGVPCAPSIEHFLRRRRWLIMTSAPLRFWLRIAASASATASVVVVPPSWSVVIVIMVIIHIACCYHIRRIHVIVAASATFLSRVGVKLIFWVDVMFR
jgi:hypothetical protein